MVQHPRIVLAWISYILRSWNAGLLPFNYFADIILQVNQTVNYQLSCLDRVREFYLLCLFFRRFYELGKRSMLFSLFLWWYSQVLSSGTLHNLPGKKTVAITTATQQMPTQGSLAQLSPLFGWVCWESVFSDICLSQGFLKWGLRTNISSPWGLLEIPGLGSTILWSGSDSCRVFRCPLKSENHWLSLSILLHEALALETQWWFSQISLKLFGFAIIHTSFCVRLWLVIFPLPLRGLCQERAAESSIL